MGLKKAEILGTSYPHSILQDVAINKFDRLLEDYTSECVFTPTLYDIQMCAYVGVKQRVFGKRDLQTFGL